MVMDQLQRTKSGGCNIILEQIISKGEDIKIREGTFYRGRISVYIIKLHRMDGSQLTTKAII